MGKSLRINLKRSRVRELEKFIDDLKVVKKFNRAVEEFKQSAGMSVAEVGRRIKELLS